MSAKAPHPGQAASVLGALPAGQKRPPLWLLALLTFSGTLAMHMFVPALPSAAAALGTSPHAIQGTISFYICGLAVGQLLYGPASDRFGRKPVLTAGLCVYVVAGLICTFATEVRVLVFARLFQALGGGAGLVIARAMVRDTSSTAEAAKRLALMNLMVTLGPGIAPLAGTLLVETLGWRAILGALALLGITNLTLVRTMLAETDAPSRRVSGNTLLGGYAVLLRSPAFLGFAFGGGCVTTSVYAFIAAAPFIFTSQFHVSTLLTGFALTAPLGGMWLGSMMASRLTGRVKLATILLRASMVSITAASVLVLLVLTGHLGPVSTVSCIFIFTASIGVASPIALTEAISVNPRMAGSASGLYGFLQMATGAVCTMLVGLGDDLALTCTAILLVTSMIAQFGFRTALRAKVK